jgi:uncharacterized protein (TIGR02466 family)
MSKLEIFKSELYIEDKSFLLPGIINKTNSIISKLKSEYTGELNGYVYHSGEILQYDEFKPISKLVLKKASDILNEQGNNIKYHKLEYTEFWVQEFGPTGFHKSHLHSNCHISGFYFINCNEETPKAVFMDPRPGKQMTQLPEKDTNQITTASEYIHIKPFPGMLLMFNSYLPHHFTINKNNNIFKFIHFNIVAKA